MTPVEKAELLGLLWAVALLGYTIHIIMWEIRGKKNDKD